MSNVVSAFALEKLTTAYSSLSYWSRSTHAQIFQFKNDSLNYVQVQSISCSSSETAGQTGKYTLARVSDKCFSFWCVFTNEARKQCQELCATGLTNDLAPCFAQISVDACYFVKSETIENMMLKKQPLVIPKSSISSDFSFADGRVIPIFESNKFIFVSATSTTLRLWGKPFLCPLEEEPLAYDRSKVQDRQRCRLADGTSFRSFSATGRDALTVKVGPSGNLVRQTRRVFLMPTVSNSGNGKSKPKSQATSKRLKPLQKVATLHNLAYLPEFALSTTQSDESQEGSMETNNEPFISSNKSDYGDNCEGPGETAIRTDETVDYTTGNNNDFVESDKQGGAQSIQVVDQQTDDCIKDTLPLNGPATTVAALDGLAEVVDSQEEPIKEIPESQTTVGVLTSRNKDAGVPLLVASHTTIVDDDKIRKKVDRHRRHNQIIQKSVCKLIAAAKNFHETET